MVETKEIVPTEEQAIVRAKSKKLYELDVLDGKPLYVDSVAGSGKTTLMNLILSGLDYNSYVYTAFNTRIVKDWGSPNAVTFHAMAKRTVGYSGGFANLRLPKHLYNDKLDNKAILLAVGKYLVSKYLTLKEYLDSMPEPLEHKEKIVAQELLDLYDLTGEGTIPFNYMLKELHKRLHSGEISLNTDVLLVDEAQDLTPVMLQIFNLIETRLKLYFGDSSQEIYSFLSLVTVFDAKTKKDTLELTTSFRASPKVGALIQTFGKKYINKDFIFTGANTSKMPKNPTIGVITYTNADIVSLTASYHRDNIYPEYTRPFKEIFRECIEIEEVLKKVSMGYARSKHPAKYRVLVDLLKSKNSTGVIKKHPDMTVSIIASLNTVKQVHKQNLTISEILRVCEKNKPKGNVLIGTAHAMKGLEFDKVVISEVLNEYVEDGLEANPENKELARLYYVAVSRARYKVENARLL